MADTSPRPFGRTFLIVVGLVVVLFAIAFYYAPGTSQARHMRQVDRFLPALQPIVAIDPRFQLVELKTYTALNGSLLIHGEVDSDPDLAALRELVGQYPCPRPIEWRVEVVAPEWRAVPGGQSPPPPPEAPPH